MQKRSGNPTSNSKSAQNKDIRIMALGGLGEVGKNCYVIEVKRDIYIIDFGVIFPDKDSLGVDYIVPNFTYLKENQDRIKGLFITHGHEDHIGGIPFLIKSLKLKNIYATQTAKLMIERKFKEHGVTTNLVEINDSTKLELGPVTIHTFRQAHSIPDAVGLFFETQFGNIVTTGDFKVDFSPPGQKTNDFHKMAELSKKGVLCFLSDSTNATTSGFSLSESVVGKNLKTLIHEAEGRILFTTFASNINRVEQIIEGAIENDRKICVIGRSLTNALLIGQKTGYLNVTNKDLIDVKQIKNFEPNKVCIISTGSQGETLAALSRIATGQNPNLQLNQDDTVVFASNPIPGNNYHIGRIIDVLTKTQCKVIKNSDVFKTHASGHASQEEQKLLLTMFKPKYFLPVHGTYNMLLAHKNTAVQIGIPSENIFITDNGDALDFYKGEPKITRKVAPGEAIYISGTNINVSRAEGTMEQLASDGIVLFTAVYDKRKTLISYPQTITRGFVVINESLPLLKKIQTAFLENYHANKNLPKDELKLKLDIKMAEFIYQETKKKPLISTNLVAYNPTKEEITSDNFNKIKA